MRSHLITHSMTHTGKKPCNCPETGCSYADVTRSTLRTHAITHNREKPFNYLETGRSLNVVTQKDCNFQTYVMTST